MRRVLLPFLLTGGLLAALPARAYDGWHLQQATVIPGKAAAWDYVSFDPGTAHLFIGHRKDGLLVFDPVAQKMVSIIDGTAAHSSNGATLIPEFDLGISSDEDGTLIPFSLSRLEARAPVKLGDALDTSHYDPASRRLLVTMDADADGTGLVVLQAPSLEKVGVLKVPSRKAEGAAADGHGGYFQAEQDLNHVLRLDTKDMKIVADWAPAGCEKPTAVAVDAARDRVFVTCRGGEHSKPALVVLNGATGAEVFTAEIGGGSDSCIYDAKSQRIFSANGVSANLTVFQQIDADSYKPVETLGTRAGMRTMAMDGEAGKIYAVTEEGTADAGKKILTAVSPFYANTFFDNTFVVLTFGRD